VLSRALGPPPTQAALVRNICRVRNIWCPPPYASLHLKHGCVHQINACIYQGTDKGTHASSAGSCLLLFSFLQQTLCLPCLHSSSASSPLPPPLLFRLLSSSASSPLHWIESPPRAFSIDSPSPAQLIHHLLPSRPRSGYRVLGLGFEFRVLGLGFEFRALGLGFRFG